MQKAIERLQKMDPVILIKYEGSVFTVAQASVVLHSGEPGKEWIATAEGIARRSHVDEPDLNRAHEIAAGRALKALAKKVICRRPIHHKFMG